MSFRDDMERAHFLSGKSEALLECAGFVQAMVRPGVSSEVAQMQVALIGKIADLHTAVRDEIRALVQKEAA